jgi:hypothetical protein
MLGALLAAVVLLSTLVFSQRCSDLDGPQGGSCGECVVATTGFATPKTCSWVHFGAPSDREAALAVSSDLSKPTGCCVSMKDDSSLSVCVKQLSAANPSGTATFTTDAASCPKPEETTDDEKKDGRAQSRALLVKLLRPADGQLDVLRALSARLENLEHTLARTSQAMQSHMNSMAYAEASCINVELIQALSFETASRITEVVFGGAPLASRWPVPGVVSGVSMPYAAMGRPPLPVDPGFLDWAERELDREVALDRYQQEASRSVAQFESPALPVDSNGNGVDPNPSGAKGAIRAVRRVEQGLRRAARHLRHALGEQQTLGTALEHGQIIGPQLFLAGVQYQVPLPYSDWRTAVEWAASVTSSLAVPDASQQSRAADLLLYHMPRVCALAGCTEFWGTRSSQLQLVGPASGQFLGSVECQRCPPGGTAELFFGERHSETEHIKHKGLDDVMKNLGTFCSRVLPYKAECLASKAEVLAQMFEATARALQDTTGGFGGIRAAADQAGTLSEQLIESSSACPSSDWEAPKRDDSK